MRSRRKKRQVTHRIEATLLDNVDAVTRLHELPDDVLEAELANAAESESYLRSVAAAHRDKGDEKDEAIADLVEYGASCCRLARELITVALARQAEGGTDPTGPSPD
jgi:hypothetical protein